MEWSGVNNPPAIDPLVTGMTMIGMEWIGYQGWTRQHFFASGGAKDKLFGVGPGIDKSFGRGKGQTLPGRGIFGSEGEFGFELYVSANALDIFRNLYRRRLLAIFGNMIQLDQYLCYITQMLIFFLFFVS